MGYHGLARACPNYESNHHCTICGFYMTEKEKSIEMTLYINALETIIFEIDSILTKQIMWKS